MKRFITSRLVKICPESPILSEENQKIWQEYEDDTRNSIIKKEGLSFAQNFDIPNIAQQYPDIYKNSCIPEAITPWSDKIQKMCEVINDK